MARGICQDVPGEVMAAVRIWLLARPHARAREGHDTQFQSLRQAKGYRRTLAFVELCGTIVSAAKIEQGLDVGPLPTLETEAREEKCGLVKGLPNRLRRGIGETER